jgi:hypothetical protein
VARARDGHVDADLAHVDVFLELARGGAALGEDGRAVAVGVGVDEGDGLIDVSASAMHSTGPKISWS